MVAFIIYNVTKYGKTKKIKVANTHNVDAYDLLCDAEQNDKFKIKGIGVLDIKSIVYTSSSISFYCKLVAKN